MSKKQKKIWVKLWVFKAFFNSPSLCSHQQMETTENGNF